LKNGSLGSLRNIRVPAADRYTGGLLPRCGVLRDCPLSRSAAGGGVPAAQFRGLGVRADGHSVLHLCRRTDGARRYSAAAGGAGRGHGRAHARRPWPGQHHGFGAVWRHLRLGRRRRDRDRRADDPADEGEGLQRRVRCQRHRDVLDHRADAAAVAQHDHLFDLGRRPALDRGSVHGRNHSRASARGLADGHRLVRRQEGRVSDRDPFPAGPCWARSSSTPFRASC
jgi:hypothetical protein